jgi:hypothetical protein
MHDAGGNPEAVPRRDDEIAALRHHRGDAGGLEDELPAPVRVPGAHACGGVSRCHRDDRSLLGLQMTGIARCGNRPASLVTGALKTMALGRCRAYAYIYIHLNS